MWYVVNGLTLTNLKNHISKKLSSYKTYKQCFNHIKEEWEKTHYLDGEYTSQAQNSSEVNKRLEWEETPADDPQEQAFQAEVNEVFQKYGRHYTNSQPDTKEPMDTDSRTTVANQAYTFNGTTMHPSVSYTPGMLNMGPMHQQWGYQNQDNQYQPYHNQCSNKQQTPVFNRFAQSSTQAKPKKHNW